MIPLLTGTLFDLGAVVVAVLLALAAYWTRSRVLIFVASVVGVSVIAGVLLFGFLAYPVLVGLAWRRPGRGFGWIFMLSVVGGTLLLARRIPVPELLPGDARERATAVVTGVRVRRHLWGWRRNAGQYVPKPFEETEYDLTMPGQPVLHLADRVDSGSVVGLRVGARVTVAYPSGLPSLSRLADGSRTWARAALLHVLRLTWSIAGGIILMAWAAGVVRRRLGQARWSPS